MLDRLWQWLDGTGVGWIALVAILGRSVWYGEQIRNGRRGVALGLLALEGATALFCGIVGAGMAEYLSLGWRSTLALICVLSWLGPGGAYALGQLALRRWLPDKKS